LTQLGTHLTQFKRNHFRFFKKMRRQKTKSPPVRG
jgi:hypothetical protein